MQVFGTHDLGLRQTRLRDASCRDASFFARFHLSFPNASDGIESWLKTSSRSYFRAQYKLIPWKPSFPALPESLLLSGFDIVVILISWFRDPEESLSVKLRKGERQWYSLAWLSPCCKWPHLRYNQIQDLRQLTKLHKALGTYPNPIIIRHSAHKNVTSRSNFKKDEIENTNWSLPWTSSAVVWYPSNLDCHGWQWKVG